MSNDTLTHHGVKGMRWGHREASDDGGGWTAPGGAKQGGGSASKAKPKAASSASSSRATASKAAPKAAAAKAAPKPAASRNFRDAAGRKSKDKEVMTPEQKAHRKKVLLGSAAVVGILGVAAVGYGGYKVSPKAVEGFGKLSLASKGKVADLMAHPEIANLKLSGGRKVNKAKLNVLFKQAELAERTSKSPLGMIAKARAAEAKRNPLVARAGIRQNLGDLRADTERMKAMNDAEDYVGKVIKRASEEKAADRFANEARNLKAMRGQKLANDVVDRANKKEARQKLTAEARQLRVAQGERIRAAARQRDQAKRGTPAERRAAAKKMIEEINANKNETKKIADDLSKVARDGAKRSRKRAEKEQKKLARL